MLTSIIGLAVTDLFIKFYRNNEDKLGNERLGQYIINRLGNEERAYLFNGNYDAENAIFYEMNNVKAYQMLMDRIHELYQAL